MADTRDIKTPRPAETPDAPGSASVSWVYLVALILSLIVLGVGIYLAATHRGWPMVAAGAACVIAVLVTWPLASQLCASRDSARQVARDVVAPVNERLEQFSI